MRGVLARFGGFCMLASLMAGCSGDARLGHGRGGLDGGTGGSSGSGGDTDAGAPGGSSGAGPGGSSGVGGGGSSGVGGTTGGPQVKSDKLDVVLMVDNSRSMASQQQMLSRVAGDLVARLTAVTDDMHIGVISSSLGGHGADTCSPASGAQFDPSQNDRAHLIASVRDAIASYNGQGFLKWDKNGAATPAGESDASALASALSSHILAAGEVGCGFESQLEAAYRFLVDPAPYQDAVQVNGQVELQGLDSVVLDQRAAFLRPDSAVLVVILSDEDDCSTFDGGIGWISAQGTSSNSTQFVMPKSTSACASNPNDACCRSCNVIEPGGPPAGCQPTTTDPACQNPYHDEMTDALQLRCWDQKRRFGVDFLYSVERYAEAFGSPTIHDRTGNVVQNPLLAGRDPSLISIASIVGVPWQDLAKNPTDPQNLDYMTPAELRANDRWTVILGDPASLVPPSDPFMRASVEPRSGQNPVTGDPILPPDSTSSNTINGHEFGSLPYAAELQYSCIYPLDTPRECGNTPGCDCATVSALVNSPICNGTTQTHGKAYPGLRHLDLMKRMGDRAAVASICPRNPNDATREDYAYRPAVRAILQRVTQTLR